MNLKTILKFAIPAIIMGFLGWGITVAAPCVVNAGCTGQANIPLGSMLYGSSTNRSLVVSPIGTNGYVWTSNGTFPSWQPSTGGSGSSTINNMLSPFTFTAGPNITISTSAPSTLTIGSKTFFATVCASGCDYNSATSTIDIAVNAAETALSASGGGKILIKAGTYAVQNSIVPKSNITLLGENGGTVFNVNDNATTTIQSSSGSFTNFTIQDITFNGTIIAEPTQPQRAKLTTTGTSTNPTNFRAVQIDGNLDPDNPSNPIISNVSLIHDVFQNIDSLPFLLNGITNVTVTQTRIENNFDPGFKNNNNVVFTDNTLIASGDNCVSMSRGDKYITMTGNVANNCADNGLWVAGFSGESGASNFTITGNTINNVGQNGIAGQLNASYGTISGNTINDGYYKGPIDVPTDAWGAGVWIEENGSTIATGTVISNNNIYQAAINCIYLHGVDSITVDGNQCLNTGTGLTSSSSAIASSSVSSNIGVLVATPATNVQVYNNTVIDNRAIPYTNLAVYPLNLAGVNEWNNIIEGGRNAQNNVIANHGVLDIGNFGPTNNIIPIAKVLIVDSTNTISSLQMQNTNAGTGADFRFIIWNQAQNEYLSINTPSDANTGALFGETRGNANFIFNNTGNGGTSRDIVIGTVGSNSVILGTNNTNRMSIDSSGHLTVTQLASCPNLQTSGAGLFSCNNTSYQTALTLPLSVTNGGTGTTTTSALWFVNGTSAYYNNGNVGIGTTTPSYKFVVAGTIQQASSTNCSLGIVTDANGVFNGCVASDSKLKTDIKNLPYQNILQQINPVSYQWKDPNRGTGIKGGFIAEDVQKVLPECVVSGGADLLAVDPNCLTAELWLQVKNLPTSHPVRSAEENWIWIAIVLLALGFCYQQTQIWNLKKFKKNSY